MDSYGSQKARISIFVVTVLVLIAWLSYQDAQGSSPTGDEYSEADQVKIYLPMLFNVSIVNGSNPLYTGPPPENPTWLEYVNYIRSLAGLPPVVDNSDWSQGDWLHSR